MHGEQPGVFSMEVVSATNAAIQIHFSSYIEFSLYGGVEGIYSGGIESGNCPPRIPGCHLAHLFTTGAYSDGGSISNLSKRVIQTAQSVRW